MKILVVLENHFYKDKEGYIWCDRVVDYNFLRRYLDVFENVILCGRCTFLEKVNDDKLLVSGEGVKFIPLPEFRGAKGIIKNIKKIRKIIRMAVKESDCVIYRAPTHLSLFTYKEVLKQKKPLAIEFMMGADKMIEGRNLVEKVLNKIIVYKAKEICMKANGVSYVTDEILQQKYPCRAIKDGESKEFFTASYSTIDIDKSKYNKQNWKSNSKPELFNIIHIGYMDSYRKGQKILLEVVKEIIDRGYLVNLTLIGDGIKRREFEKISEDLGISKNVKFLGLVKKQDEILKLLHDSHILVFPTQSEGLPRTIIEAMSQGLPCISSPVDGIPELLDEEFMIDYNDVDSYVNKIVELFDNWDRMIEISESNFLKSKRYEKEILNSKRKIFYNKLKRMAMYGTNEK